jgi:zinc resistance-associated protein
MWKAVLAGTTALAIVGSTVVYAQQRAAPPERQRWQPSQEDMQAFADARIAALKAGLMLNADQQKNWPAFESALNDLAKLRIERRMARRNEGPAKDPTERLQRRADAMSTMGAALKKLADAQGPLYSSLDEAQKRRFAMLSHLRRGGPGWRHHRGPERAGMRPGGFRGPDGRAGFERRGAAFGPGMHGAERQAWRWHHRGMWGYGPDDANANPPSTPGHEPSTPNGGPQRQ